MTRTSGDRAQTLHDFAIGMVIFLLILGYVFAFIPGLFDPFAPESHSTAVRVDRTADYLTTDLLASKGATGRLNESCTRAFFNVTSPSNCDRFSEEVDAAYIRTLVGLPAQSDVNITLVRDEGPATDPKTGELLTVGTSPDDAFGRVIRAVRVVSFDGRDYRFVVRLW